MGTVKVEGPRGREPGGPCGVQFNNTTATEAILLDTPAGVKSNPPLGFYDIGKAEQPPAMRPRRKHSPIGGWKILVEAQFGPTLVMLTGSRPKDNPARQAPIALSRSGLSYTQALEKSNGIKLALTRGSQPSLRSKEQNGCQPYNKIPNNASL